jgi:activator of 2-hydroxyglutaryl-CoA dehydratase
LYSQPRTVIDQDLIELAGGVEAIIERARLKLAEHKYVEALYLLDIVRPQHGHIPGAVTAALLAHEALLRDSANFWLSSWLKNQIKLLQNRRA